MLLREARPGDLPALLDVQQAGAVLGMGHIFPQHTHPFPRAALLERWTAEIADPGIAAYVIVTDRIAGFAALRGDEVLHFGTAVDTWGSGLAAAAHGELLQQLTARGVRRARLRVFEENRRARRFWEKLGWQPTGERSRTSFPPHPVLLAYRRDLVAAVRLGAA